MWAPRCFGKTSMCAYGTWCWSRGSPASGTGMGCTTPFIVTRPGRLKAEYEDGSESVTDLHLGQVVMGQKDSLHKVTNVGTELYSNAIVEMKH